MEERERGGGRTQKEQERGGKEKNVCKRGSTKSRKKGAKRKKKGSRACTQRVRSVVWGSWLASIRKTHRCGGRSNV